MMLVSTIEVLLARWPKDEGREKRDVCRISLAPLVHGIEQANFLGRYDNQKLELSFRAGENLRQHILRIAKRQRR